MEPTEEFARFPFFMLIDVSASMDGKPLDALNEMLPAMWEEVIRNPMVGEVARIGLITFSTDAQTVIPLSDLTEVSPPILQAGGETNFASAFRETWIAIDAGMRSFPTGTPIYRPVVFMLSDGQHTADESWQTAHRQLISRQWKYAPEIVTFGFGEADDETLRKIATRYAFRAKDAPPSDQVREIINALLGSVRATSTSFHLPDSDGAELQIDAPDEFFTSLPPLSLDDGNSAPEVE